MLKVGNTYTTNDGRSVTIVGMLGDNPCEVDNLGYGPFVSKEFGLYHSDGKFGSRNCVNLDISDVDASPQTGTLKELNVKPGDVVECIRGGGRPAIIVGENGDTVYKYKSGNGMPISWAVETYKIISRAATRDPELTSPYGDNNHPLPDNKPKTWGEMTDAEKGALLLAEHEGVLIEAHDSEDWYITSEPSFANGIAYRIRPHLPLEKDKVYELEDGQEWECLFVRGDNAWLSYSSNGTAYRWNANTGENISQGGGKYNVKGLVQ